MSRLFAVAACLTLGLWNAPAHASQDCPILEGWQALFDEDGLSCFESEYGLANHERLREETVRRQVEAQAGALPPEARRALVRQALVDWVELQLRAK